MKIDVHIHLTGTGCCNSGAWTSPAFRRRHTIRLLQLLHHITDHQMATTLDGDWATMVAKTVRESGVDRGVVLGFDGVYSRGNGAWDEHDSQMMIPPEWVFAVCRKHPELLPGPSINPYRSDALERLAFCIEQGAVLIKWLPAAQAIDPADQQIDAFYRLAAAAKIPLLIHMGGERTFRSITPEFNNVERLRRPLDLGVPVICAHTATRVLGTREPDQLPQLKALLRTYPHLWLDNSGFCNPSRWAHLPRLARDPEIVSRTLYGSDFPVPANAFYYVGKMPIKQIVRYERLNNTIARDVAIKTHFGYDAASLTRAGDILANLPRWPAR